MATLILRGTTWHMYWRWRGCQKTRSTKVEHDGRYRNGVPVPPAAAKRELRRLENELDAGRNLDNKTLSALLDLVEKEYVVGGFSSLPSLKSRLAHLREWFGNLRADRIEDADGLHYAEFRQKQGASNTSIRREWEMLRKACRMGKILPPAVLTLAVPPPRQGFFDDAMIQALTRRLPDYLRGPAWFGYYTGWRREEVFSLQWPQVDFAVGEVRLWTSKNDKPRAFPLDVVPGLRMLLEEQDEKRRAWLKEGIIVPWVFGRQRRESRQVRRIVEFRKAWDGACRKAGIPGMHFHDLRRSAARNLDNAGWTRSLIKSWMGHETDAMFERYRMISAADRAIVGEYIKAQRSLVETSLASKLLATPSAATDKPKKTKD